MAQELTTLVAFAEDLVSVPSTHIKTHNSNSRDSNILFASLEDIAHKWGTNTCSGPYT